MKSSWEETGKLRVHKIRDPTKASLRFIWWINYSKYYPIYKIRNPIRDHQKSNKENRNMKSIKFNKKLQDSQIHKTICTTLLLMVENSTRYLLIILEIQQWIHENKKSISNHYKNLRGKSKHPQIIIKVNMEIFSSQDQKFNEKSLWNRNNEIGSIKYTNHHRS